MIAALAVPNAHSSIWFYTYASPRSCNASEIINLRTFWHYLQQKWVLDVHIGSVGITGERWPILVADGHRKMSFHGCFHTAAPLTPSEELGLLQQCLRSLFQIPSGNISKSHCYWIKENSIAPEHSGLFLWIFGNRGSWVPRINYGWPLLEG